LAQRTRSQRPVERDELSLQRLAARLPSPAAFGPIIANMPHEQDGVGRPGQTAQKLAQGGDRAGQRDRIVERGRRLHERQHLLDRRAKRRERSVQFAVAFRRHDLGQLLPNRCKKRLAIEPLVLVEVVAHAHSQGVQRCRLMRVAGYENGDDIGMKNRKVLEQLQAIVTGAEVPIEHGQIDRRLIGVAEGTLGISRRQYAAFQPARLQPFLKCPADRFFIIHDQNRFTHDPASFKVRT
jgi:hypothetical protein